MSTRSMQTKLDGSGTGLLTFQNNLPALLYDVEQIAVTTSPTSTATLAYIFFNGDFVCGTVAGSADTAIGPPDIILRAGEPIVVEWLNGPAGAFATATFSYTEMYST